jgi:hypothetical protein
VAGACRERVQQRVRERLDEQLRLMQEACPVQQSLDLSLESLAGGRELTLSALDADTSDDEEESEAFGQGSMTGPWKAALLTCTVLLHEVHFMPTWGTSAQRNTCRISLYIWSRT